MIPDEFLETSAFIGGGFREESTQKCVRICDHSGDGAGGLRDRSSTIPTKKQLENGTLSVVPETSLEEGCVVFSLLGEDAF